MHSSRIHTACSLPHMGRGWGREGALSKGSLSRRSLSYNNAFQYDAYLTYSNTVKIPNLSQMHQKCIRNVSEIYPKFNPLSLDLSHSNTVKIKTSIHISPYITYIYPTFIPNSNFSPYISLTQIL